MTVYEDYAIHLWKIQTWFLTWGGIAGIAIRPQKKLLNDAKFILTELGTALKLD